MLLAPRRAHADRRESHSSEARAADHNRVKQLAGATRRLLAGETAFRVKRQDWQPALGNYGESPSYA
jgi:hypothetical protein